MQKGTSFRDELIAHGVLVPSGVDGVYGRNGLFESIVNGIEQLITQVGQDYGAEVIRFPPAMPKSVMETSGYLNGFPHLAGTIHCFCGDDRAHARLLDDLATGKNWTVDQQCIDLTLTPAACYPVYPMVAARGQLTSSRHIFDVSSYCFRHEPSLDPARMQMFRMREFVCLGRPKNVQQFRDDWLEGGQQLIRKLELPFSVDLANDPFFGRGGTFMAKSQREQALKFELLVPIVNDDRPTACLSFNYHMEHFSEIWRLTTDDGAMAHTACVGFGLERLTLALLRRHGFDLRSWPRQVRDELWL